MRWQPLQRSSVGVRRMLPVLLATTVGLSVPAAAAETVRVGPGGAFRDLQDAMGAARDGDTVEVVGGVHAGPLTVDRSISLVGVGTPVIEGGGVGTVVRITAPGVRLEGFLIRDSGSSLEAENSAVAVEAPDAVIADNRIENALFGVYLRKGHGTLIRNNRITGQDLAVPRRGDPIRVWYSSRVTIEGNVVERGRDVVLWYSQVLTVRDNLVLDGRYGLHFMYCDDARVEANRLLRNSVGGFLMYSRRLHLARNLIAHNRGPSGYGVGLKDLDDAVLEANVLADNRVGIFVDNSPREIDSTTRIEGNVVAYNDFGIEMMPAVRRNLVSFNSFVDNHEQVAVAGGGTLRGNQWTVDGRGNFWSDYTGYDLDDDGEGDVPYRPRRLSEGLMDRNPELRLFLFSPATDALDFAARAFPVVQAPPKLEDSAPLMRPRWPRGVPVPPSPRRAPLAAAATTLLLGAGVILLLPSWTGGGPGRRQLAAPGEGPMLRVRGLTKRFGRLTALDHLDFEVARGEAVALWGGNGAGKTTALRAVLGVLPCDGSVEVDGRLVAEEGKECRRRVGFVPQELAFHPDLSVAETREFYARLKGAPAPPALPLEDLGLADQLAKPVSELSGGMKRRLALALALIGDPPLLLLDEPTANLDAGVRDAYLELVGELKAGGKTLLFTSHRLDDVTRLADRVVVLEEGRKVREGSLEELGGGVRLRLRMSQERVEDALAVLKRHRIEAQRNGSGVFVRVDARRKVEPVARLAAAGIEVQDFEVRWSEGGLEPWS